MIHLPRLDLRPTGPIPAPIPRTKPYWAFVSLVLTVCLCILMTLCAKQAERSYADERARDEVYQLNSHLSRALIQAYIVQAFMIQDQLDHPSTPRAHHAY